MLPSSSNNFGSSNHILPHQAQPRALSPIKPHCNLAQYDPIVLLQPMDSSAYSHVFSIDLLVDHATKSHCVITSMDAGNDVIVLGISKGFLIRYDFNMGNSFDFDLTGSRGGNQAVHRVFLDPGGSHCIVNVVYGGGGAESYYKPAKWVRPRILSRLKGLIVNAVAWNRQQITESSTQEVLIGTENGQIYEIAVDETDKKEKLSSGCVITLFQSIIHN